MDINTTLILIGSTLAVSFSIWARQWLFAVTVTFSGVYTLFDKVFPSVLPKAVVASFVYIFLALTIFQLFLLLTHRKRHVSKNLTAKGTRT